MNLKQQQQEETASQQGRAITFGEWRFQPDQNLLCGPSGDVRIENKQAQVLLYLIACADQVATKDDLLNAVWEGKFVGDDVLAVAISHLRKTLGDDARKPRFIKTEPRRGYRFVGSVNAEQQKRAHRVITGESWEDAVRETRATKIPTSWIAIAIVVFLGGLVASSMYWTPGQPETQATSLDQASVSGKSANLLLAKDDVESWRRAYQLFAEASAQDSQNARAYLGMVQAQLKILKGRYDLLYQARHELEALLDKAAQIEPENPDIQLMLAHLSFRILWDFQAAEQHYQRALSIDNQQPQYFMSYAQFKLAMGDFESVHVALETALRLDPRLYAQVESVWLLNMQRRYDEALLGLEKMLEVSPKSRLYHVSAQSIFENIGEDKISYRHLRSVLELSAYNAEDLAAADKRFEEAGLSGVYAWLSEEGVQKENIGQYEPPLSLARYAIKAGQHDQALAAIEAALATRQVQLLWIGVDPKYDPLRSHPRFQAVMRAVGLPQKAS